MSYFLGFKRGHPMKVFASHTHKLILMFLLTIVFSGCEQIGEITSGGGAKSSSTEQASTAQTSTGTISGINDGGVADSSAPPATPALKSWDTVLAELGLTKDEDSNSSDNSPDSSSDDSPDSINNAPSLSTTRIVWKPVSENDEKLAILTPTSYGTPSITILDEGGNKVEQGRYIKHTNGNRATYRFSKPGRKYSAPAYLRVDSKIYLVARPGSRYN